MRLKTLHLDARDESVYSGVITVLSVESKRCCLHVELFEKVVALVVAHYEGREVLDLNLPDGLHAQLRVLEHIHFLDAFLGCVCMCAWCRARGCVRACPGLPGRCRNLSSIGIVKGININQRSLTIKCKLMCASGTPRIAAGPPMEPR